MDLPEISENNRRYINERLDKHNSDISSNFKDASERVSKYLFFTNAGGSAAVLSYLATTHPDNIIPGIYGALYSFLIGLIFLGFNLGANYHAINLIFLGWRNNQKKFVRGDCDWNGLFDSSQYDKTLYWLNFVATLLAWLSFAAFVCGVCIPIFSGECT